LRRVAKLDFFVDRVFALVPLFGFAMPETLIMNVLSAQFPNNLHQICANFGDDGSLAR